MAKPPPRLFVESDLGPAAGVPLTPDQVHYLVKVMRLQTGAEVALFNGRDGEWRASLAELSRKLGRAECEEQLRAQPKEAAVTLLFAPTKKSPTEFLVQKATELGATTLQPIKTHRTIESRNSPRWRLIVTEAAEQCERLSVPEIKDIASLDDALDARPDHRFLFADEAGNGPDEKCSSDQGKAPSAMKVLAGQPSDGPWAIIIGPAGGFTDEERAMLRADVRCVPISLGPRILKAETAAIAALTLWQAVLGDLTD